MAAKKRSTLTASDLAKTTSSRGGSVVRGLLSGDGEGGVTMVKTDQIAPNPFNPPERSISDEGLAQSIGAMRAVAHAAGTAG